MRLRRLDLLRFGHFTDASLSMPPTLPDLHIIFGPNEAGKSTTLRAIEDLLFGFERQSSFNFLHGYGDLRVGGVLEHQGETLDVRRRKGNRDTLLGPDDGPLPGGEPRLRPFLGVTDRNFFTHMFSLDHERLAQGGREILHARNEVGQTLFAAGTGLSGLREYQKSLEDRADALWAARRSNRRAYYIAADALDDASRALRERTVTASQWQSARQRMEAAREARETLQATVMQHEADLRRLGRIRRVHRDVHDLAGAQAELASLADLPQLPEDAQATLDQARQKLSTARFMLEELARQRALLAQAHAALHYDGIVLQRAADIGQLCTQRIETRKEQADLPQLKARLAAREQHLVALARELGWPADDAATIAARIPPRAGETGAKALLNQYSGLAEAVRNAQANLAESTRHLQELRDRLPLHEAAADVTALAAEIAAVRPDRDIEARLDHGRQELAALAADITLRLERLRPRIDGPEALQAFPMPPREAVQRQRDRLRDLEQKADACRDAIAATEGRMRELSQGIPQYGRGPVPSVTDLQHARRARDTGWALIRRHFIERQPLSDAQRRDLAASPEQVPAWYEEKVRIADQLADRRHEAAEALARAAEVERQLEGLGVALDEQRREASALAHQRDALDAQWRVLWAEAPFEALPPDAMLAWMDDCAALLARAQEHSKLASQVAQLQAAARRAHDGLACELRALAGTRADDFETRSVAALLEQAHMLQQREELRAREHAQVVEQVRKLEQEVARTREQLDRARADMDRWQAQWRTTLQALGFAPDATPQRVASHLEIVESMRAAAHEAAQLRNERIAPMEADIQAFEAAAQSLVREAAPDLAHLAPGDAILEVEARLASARRARDQQAEKRRAIDALETQIAQYRQDETDARHGIEVLQQAAGAHDPGQLEQTLRGVRRRHDLVKMKQALEDTLKTAADGLSLDELRVECRDVDLDQAVTQEAARQEELDALRGELTQAILRHSEAQKAFDAIGGDASAIEAASARQEALASMRDAAGQYIRVRAAALLLEWTMARYQRDMQGPLLKRASDIFRTLTLESFAGLRVDQDEHDAPVLRGLRPDGSQVDVTGMSEGTTDQLYLALRVASIGEYLIHGHPLPFVADDLFVNFDDARARAGLAVLADLARRTQVLFFTHHRHLVEVAREVLGGDANIIELQPAATNSSYGY